MHRRKCHQDNERFTESGPGTSVAEDPNRRVEAEEREGGQTDNVIQLQVAGSVLLSLKLDRLWPCA